MDITFGFWHILIAAAAAGVGLILAANAKLLWANRYDAAVVTGGLLLGASAVSSAIYGINRSLVRRDIEAEEHRRIAAEERQQYLPGIWVNVYDAVDGAYGWEAKWAILEAVPVRYGIENVHALPGQGFDLILREFHGVQVKTAVRELLRPYITPFLDDGIGCASITEAVFGELLVLHRKETE